MAVALAEQQNRFHREHFVQIAQIDEVTKLQYLFELARLLREMRSEKNPVLEQVLKTHTIAIMFYQPSTRTEGSFSSAAKALGAVVVEVQDMGEYSSAAKGEIVEDSLLTAAFSWQADLTVQRHPDNNSSLAGVAEMDRLSVDMLMVNAGSGTAEHPTQALLDAFTIQERFGRLDNLNIVMVGDMLFGRTVKSLAKLLAKFDGNTITFVAPEGIEMPREFIEELEGKVTIIEQDTLEGCEDADVVYWTRLQKEWFVQAGRLEFYEEIKDQFVLTPEIASLFKDSTIFMHPLPRVNEIERTVDLDPRAVYWKDEMAAGNAVRMALLVAMLIENPFSYIEMLQHKQDVLDILTEHPNLVAKVLAHAEEEKNQINK